MLVRMYVRCEYLQDWCDGARAFFQQRIVDDCSPHYRLMLTCRDLRVLIRPPQTEEAVEVQLAALKKLWVWMRRSVGRSICLAILR
jgi:hypothetical protein